MSSTLQKNFPKLPHKEKSLSPLNEVENAIKAKDEVIDLLSVGIIGVGRMGQQLAKAFADKCTLWLYDKDRQKAAAVTEELGVKHACFQDLFSLEILIMALPTPVMPQMCRELAPHMKEGQILVNVATTQPKKPLIEIIGSRATVISAKVIGHAYEIASGEEPTIIVDGDDAPAVKKVEDLFIHFGRVETAPEELVAKLNTIASGEGIKAAYIIKKRMEQEGIPLKYWETAVRNVAAGTMKAFASGDAGPFAQQVIEEMEAKEDAREDDAVK